MGWLIALFEFDYVCSDHITFVKVFFVYETLHGSPTLLVKNGTDSMPVPIDVMLFSSVRRGICKFSRLSRLLLNLPQGLSLDWLHV